MQDFTFKFNYTYTTVGVIGQSRSGKSYQTSRLCALADKRCSVLAAYPDQRAQFSDYSNDIKIAGDREFNAQAVSNFIEQRIRHRYWLLVFDDLDYFIHHENESELLTNLPIASKGHWLHGNIWQSRRVINLPYELVQNSDYMIFAYGVARQDYKKLEEYAGLDLDLYSQVRPPVRNTQDPRKLAYAEFVLLERETGLQKIISGVS